MKKLLIVNCALVAIVSLAYKAQAQNSQVIQQYIERYRNLAMSEQQRSGIPAAIKLAQGIHESGAGKSELAVNANNHFGIKCKSNWTGERYTYSDNRPNECFRKYSMDFASYQDHSNYLRSNPRYAFLFKLSVTDYAAWAIGLRKAGYATNPNYPKRLITIIETYHLQQYTYAAMDNKDFNAGNFIASAPVKKVPVQKRAVTQPTYSKPTTTQPVAEEKENVISKLFGKKNTTQKPVATKPNYKSAPVQARATVPVTASTTPVAVTPAPVRKNTPTQARRQSGYTRSYTRKQTSTSNKDHGQTVVKVNGLRAVYARKGEMPLQYAMRNKIRYENLLKWNDIQDAPLPADMPLYLERKHFWGVRPMHLVKPGETMLVIAQKEGIQLKYLRDLNYMEEDEQPVPGITLELVQQAAEKPRVIISQPEPVPVQKPVVASTPTRTQPNTSYGKPQQDPTVTNPRYVPRNGDGTPMAKTTYQQQPAAQESVNTRQVTDDIVNGRPAQNTNTYQQPVQQQAATNSGYSGYRSSGYSRRGVNERNSRSTAIGNDELSQLKRQFDGAIYSDAPAQQQQVVQRQAQNANLQYLERTPPPPPAASVQKKTARELRRERKEAERLAEEQRKNTRPAGAHLPYSTNTTQQPAAVTARTPSQPQSELDQLKSQFDDAVYTQQGSPERQQPMYNNEQRANPSGRLPVSHDPAKFYKVKRGDTAYTIAKKHGITIRQLMDWNGLDFDAIKEGQTLRIKP